MAVRMARGHFASEKTTGYYTSFAASYGLQAGAETFGYALFFPDDEGVDGGSWYPGQGFRHLRQENKAEQKCAEEIELALKDCISPCMKTCEEDGSVVGISEKLQLK